MKGAILGLCLVMLLTTPALATEFRTGEAITVGPDEIIDDDLIAAGASVAVQGKVTGDIVAAGRTVRVTGPVGGSVIAAGQEVVVTGDVGGSVRAAGRSVTLGGTVRRNAQAAAQSLVLSETADIKKDVHVAGTTFDLDGTIGRLLGVAAETAAIRGSVGGDVLFEGQHLSLGPAAKVAGAVSYRSEAEPEIAPGATVAGGITKLPPRPEAGRKGGVSPVRFVLKLLAWFVFGAAGIALLPRIFLAATAAVGVRFWWNLLLGFLVLVAGPIAAIVVMVTVIGLPLGLVALVALLIALLFSSIPVGTYLGGRLFRSASPYFALLVGLLVLGLLGLVPYLGFVVKLVTVLLGLAVYARALKGLIVEMRLQHA